MESGRIKLPNVGGGWRASPMLRDNEKPAVKTPRGRRTRDKLLTSARLVFERNGFLHTRVQDICQEADTSQGTFYVYFRSKEDVFREVVDSVEFGLLRFERPSGEISAFDRIQLANRHYLEFYRDNAAILRVITQVSTFDSDVLEMQLRREAELATAIEKRTRQDQADGLVSPAVDARYAAYALGGMVRDFAQQMFFQGLDVDMDRAVEQLTRLWVNALGIGVASNGTAPEHR